VAAHVEVARVVDEDVVDVAAEIDKLVAKPAFSATSRALDVSG
jgi:hypothetical protein